MQFHEVANIFPMMNAEEFEALKADIQQNGLREPIWLHDNRIIDGRNRYNACRELGIEPTFRQWDGEGSLVAFVVSLNLNRRHLSSSQKAIIALDVEPLLAEEAKKRQIQLAGTRPNASRDLTQKIEQGAKKNGHSAAAQAAAIVGTNRQYVSDAKKLATAAPEILPLVRSGEVSMVEARTVLAMTDKTREAVIAKIVEGEARSVKDARRVLQREENAAPGVCLSTVLDEAPELAAYQEAVERREVEVLRYSGLVSGANFGRFAGLRFKNLATPIAGQTWHWPKYTGAVVASIDERLNAVSPDLETPLFTAQEWEEFTRLDELEAAANMVYPGCEWVRWSFGMEFSWSATNFLRKPWEEGHMRRRDYDPEYGRAFIDCLDDSCSDCKGKQMFIRRGWGQWYVVEYNDGQGGREKRRFFEHDHCGPTLIQQAIETVDPLAFSYSNLKRLNIFKAMPVEISWHAMRRKTIDLEMAVKELEADLEALRKMQPLTDDELTDRVLDWLQSFTPSQPDQWREGESTYPRLPDGALDREYLRNVRAAQRQYAEG